MIVSNKLKVYNAEFSKEAENLFNKTIDEILQMKILGIKRKTMIKYLDVCQEFPSGDYPEYRYIWIEASGRLAEKIQAHKNNHEP